MDGFQAGGEGGEVVNGKEAMFESVVVGWLAAAAANFRGEGLGKGGEVFSMYFPIMQEVKAERLNISTFVLGREEGKTAFLDRAVNECATAGSNGNIVN